MGRPRKYNNSQERDEATKEQKRNWYQNNKSIVSRRRRNTRRRAAAAKQVDGVVANPVLDPKPTDPVALLSYIRATLAIAPSPSSSSLSSISDACTFWRKFESRVVDGGNLQQFGSVLFDSLSNLPDDDPALVEYTNVRTVTGELATRLHSLVDCAAAFDDTDPTNFVSTTKTTEPRCQGDIYDEARAICLSITSIHDIIDELVISRAESVRCLVALESDGALLYQKLQQYDDALPGREELTPDIKREADE